MAGRGIRSDAVANRERLIGAARAAFTSADSTVALETIASDAGVGIGTLYRHFPSREALVEAVYRHDLARLCHGADRLLIGHRPPVALRRWMSDYADFVAAKRGMAAAMADVIASGAVEFRDTRRNLAGAVDTFLRPGAAAGELRDDVSAVDVVAVLAGIMLAAGSRDQVERLFDLQLAALTRTI